MTVPLYLCICVGLPPYLVSRFNLTPTPGFYMSLYSPPCVPNDEGSTYVKTTVTPSNTETLGESNREAGNRPDGRKNQGGRG